jgi:hypothetical protein
VAQGGGCEAAPDPALMAAADLAWAAVQVKETERRVILAGRPAVVDDDMERARELANIEAARGMLPPHMSVLRFFPLPPGVEKKGNGCSAPPLCRCAAALPWLRPPRRTFAEPPY